MALRRTAARLFPAGFPRSGGAAGVPGGAAGHLCLAGQRRLVGRAPTQPYATLPMHKLVVQVAPRRVVRRRGRARSPEVEHPPSVVHKGTFEWIDISGEDVDVDVDSYRDYAMSFLREMGLSENLLQEVGATGVLPMYATEGPFTVFVLRLSNYHELSPDDLGIWRPLPQKPLFGGDEPSASDQAWSLSDLTDRLTIVVDNKAKKVVTMHAHTMRFLVNLRKEHLADGAGGVDDDFVWNVMHRLLTENTLSHLANKSVFDEMEKMFVSRARAGELLSGKGISRGVYAVMRRASVNSRLLKSTLQMMRDIRHEPPEWAPRCKASPLFRRAYERAQQTQGFADELHVGAKDLLALHFGTAAHQTNELVKVFNILSATFLPLSFLVGFYGMNFDYLPGTGKIAGIDGVWYMMAGIIVTAGSFLGFFRLKGWL